MVRTKGINVHEAFITVPGHIYINITQVDFFFLNYRPYTGVTQRVSVILKDSGSVAFGPSILHVPLFY